MIVATTAVVPVFKAVKLAIFPVPLAASPILVVLFVQLYAVPGTADPVKLIAPVVVLLHLVIDVMPFTVGSGLTVITTSDVDAGHGELLIVHLNV